MSRVYAYAIAALVIVATLGACAWKIYDHAYTAGMNACEAAHAKAANVAAVEIDRRDAAGAEASTTMLDYLRANLPPIQEKARDAIERVRTIYRDRPIPVDACVRPVGVQAELDAARQRANTAARRLPNPADSARAADPAARADGRVGDRSHGSD
jgi:hypothetical protein